jgi:hypothetical protein
MIFIITDKTQPRQSHRLRLSPFIGDPNQLLLPDFQFTQNQPKLNNNMGNEKEKPLEIFKKLNSLLAP